MVAESSQCLKMPEEFSISSYALQVITRRARRHYVAMRVVSTQFFRHPMLSVDSGSLESAVVAGFTQLMNLGQPKFTSKA